MKTDLNLLLTLDALLSEGSVTGAAQRMNLSAPAMSRQLSRIRHLFGDPILVRAGRGLVSTPRAEELRGRLRQLVLDADDLLRRGDSVDPAEIDRTFVIRANDGFVGGFGASIARAAAVVAPKVRLRFAPQGEEDVEALREGKVDLDVGVIGATGPEVRLQALFHDRFVTVVRKGHPLCEDPSSLRCFTAFPHLSVSRRGRFQGPIDTALAKKSMERRVVLAVATFADALAIARTSDFIAAVPDRLTRDLREGLTSFSLPVETDAQAVSQAWHPRVDADPAHRWLRMLLREVCCDRQRSKA